MKTMIIMVMITIVDNDAADHHQCSDGEGYDDDYEDDDDDKYYDGDDEYDDGVDDDDDDNGIVLPVSNYLRIGIRISECNRIDIILANKSVCETSSSAGFVSICIHTHTSLEVLL